MVCTTYRCGRWHRRRERIRDWGQNKMKNKGRIKHSKKDNRFYDILSTEEPTNPYIKNFRQNFNMTSESKNTDFCSPYISLNSDMNWTRSNVGNRKFWKPVRSVHCHPWKVSWTTFGFWDDQHDMRSTNGHQLSVIYPANIWYTINLTSE